MVASLNDRITTRLYQAPASVSELMQGLGVSRQTVWRALQTLEAEGRVVHMGTTRDARYGVAHAIGSTGSHWPIYRVDEEGSPIALAELYAIEHNRYYVRGGPARMAALSDGLPYFLQDARPAGFLGRAIPSACPELGLPGRVLDWTDDHVLTYLALRGSEVIGDLILGREALNRYLSGEHGPAIVNADSRHTRYLELADQAMAGAPPGSSAHGEHPKFSVRLGQESGLLHALVKFSPPRDSAIGERWADLLIAEGVASDLLSSNGIQAATSHVLEYGDRVFLESVRFDRVGTDGRRGVASLLAVDAQHYGMLDRWALSAARLRADRLLSAEDAEHIALLDAFGGLIGNTDRHFGNITLFDTRDGAFALAPAYDMLPMLFAPAEGQLIERAFVPEGVRAETLTTWPRARTLAVNYWTLLTEDTRLTRSFRERAGTCLASVAELPARGGVSRRSPPRQVA